MNDASVMRRIVAGAAAGAAGSAVLNVATYVDMLVRGRAPSAVPKEDVQRVEAKASPPGPNEGASEARSHRESAAGALIGYVVGLGIGAITGALWPVLRWLPLPIAAAVVGGSAMAGSDVPSVALGTTDPRSWKASGWAADIVPHVAYGLVTTAVTDALLSPGPRRRVG